MAIISLAIRSGIAFTAIYWTRENKVWGSSKDTTQLYEKLLVKADPTLKTVKSKIPFDVPLLPSSGETCFLVKHYYNNGVKNTIHFIHRFPCYIGQWAKKGKDAVQSVLDAPPVKQ